MIPSGLPGAGDVLILDNGGMAGYGDSSPSCLNGAYNACRPYSRVLEINPVTLDIVWSYNDCREFHQSALSRFFSAIRSGMQRLPDGHTLTCESTSGRVFEVTVEGEIVGEYVDPTGCLFRAHRYPCDWAPLERPGKRPWSRRSTARCGWKTARPPRTTTRTFAATSPATWTPSCPPCPRAAALEVRKRGGERGVPAWWSFRRHRKSAPHFQCGERRTSAAAGCACTRGTFVSHGSASRDLHPLLVPLHVGFQPAGGRRSKRADARCPAGLKEKENNMSTDLASRKTRQQWTGLVAGPVVCLLICLLPPVEGLSAEGMRALGGLAWMVAWWSTEALNLFVTALWAFLIFPLLGVGDPVEMFQSFGSSTVMLLMGATIILGVWSESHLITRYAYWALNLRVVRNRPARLITVFCLSCGVLSMFVPNIPVTILFGSIAVALAANMDLKPGQSAIIRNMGVLSSLASAYGGIATPLGGTLNIIAMGLVAQSLDYEVGFFQWTLLGLPIALALLVLLIPVGLVCFPLRGKEKDTLPVPREYLEEKLANLGPISPHEHVAVLTLLFALVLWAVGPQIGRLLHLPPSFTGTPTVALVVGALLFVIPIGRNDESGDIIFAMSWPQARLSIAWGGIVLIGGTLGMSDVLLKHGIDTWAAGHLHHLFGGMPGPLVWLCMLWLCIIVSQFLTITIGIFVFTPLMASIAVLYGFNPMAACLTNAMAANLATMFPFTTPLVAAALGSSRGFSRGRDFVLVSAVMTFAGGLVVFLVGWFLGPLIVPAP